MFDLKKLLDERGDESHALLAKHLNPALAKVLCILGFDVPFVRGQGAYLWDKQGQRYIDCVGGYAVFNVGRNHPVVRDAIRQAMDMDLPNLLKLGTPRLAGLLAERLIDLAPEGLDTVFFCNSGAEGVETAIKYARAFTGRDRMVYCKKGFHGLTMGALSLNGAPEFREGFGVMLGPATAIPFNDLEALKSELVREDVAGFIVEPIQGKGVNMPDDNYLAEAEALCRQHGSLFIVDEVQTGFGRTGKMWACEHWNITPDIMVVAKGLSGGYVPVGAVFCQRRIHDKVFSSLDRCVVHSTTFGQNDLAMAAGLATLHVLETEKIPQHCQQVGEQLMQGLDALRDKYQMLKQVRGKGLMIGLAFGAPSSLKLKMGWSLLHKLDQSLFCQAMLIPLLTDHHVLAQVAGHHMDTIKLIPPLVLSSEDVVVLVEAFDAVIGACHRFPGPVWEVGKRLAEHSVKKRA